MITVVRVKGLLPMTGVPALQQAALVLEGGQIRDILSWDNAAQAYPQAETVTYAEAWALPGFIDAHVHLCFSGSNTPLEDMLAEKDDEALMILRMVKNCQTAILAGVTTVRDCGAGSNAIYRLRDALRQGMLSGCDIVACGQPFTVTGGHCWFLNREVEGVDAVRRCARQSLKDGAQFLKMMVSGGNMTPGSGSGVLQYSSEEVRAMTDEARMRGAKTAVHVHSTESIRMAVAAGVTSLEHVSFRGPDGGTDYDPAVVDEMATRDMVFSPAFSASYRTPISSFPAEKQAFWTQFREARMDVSRRIIRQGVRLALGTDAGCHLTRFEDFALCFDIMREHLHLSPMQVLMAATRDAAECCGILHETGTLEVGKRADITLLARDPLADLTAGRDVVAVYKAGRLVVEHGRLVC